MTVLAFSILSTALFSTAAISLGALSLRLKRTSDDDAAFVWWVTCAGILAWFLGSVALPFRDPISMALLEKSGWVRLFAGIPYYRGETGWRPWSGGETAIATLVVVWLGIAGALLLIRGYQLFLAAQFAVWSLDIEDERVESNLRSLNPLSKVRARTSNILRSPAVVGIWRTTLLIPTGLTQKMPEAHIRAILAHELAHIRGRDTLTVIAMLACEAILWFNPLVWWMHREWGAARECAADRQALTATKISAPEFGQLLLDIVGSARQPFLQTSIGATRDFKTLKRRILTMTHTNQTGRDSRPFRWAVGLCMTGALVVPFSSAFASQSLANGNVVSNGGFEQGLAKWERSDLGGRTDEVAFAIDTNTKHSGDSSLRMTKTNPRYWPVQMVGQEDVGTSGITNRLRVSAWAKANKATKLTIAVHFRNESETSGIEFATFVGGDQPATHDWKKYDKVIEVPEGTKSLGVFVQMYGPGEVWLDDLDIRYAAKDTPTNAAPTESDPEIETIEIKERFLNDDPRKQVQFIRGGLTEPEKGFKLAVILPGGDGSAEFKYFIRRMFFYCGETPGFVYTQLVAPKWTEPQGIVWPIAKNRPPEAKFTTETFIQEAIADAKKQVKIDPEHVYVFGWSSSGPAVYASLLRLPEVKGAFVGMSVFRSDDYPSLEPAKGKRLYLYQSPDDKLTQLRWAKDAEAKFGAAGAAVKLVEYSGGHGFQSGDVFGDIGKGFDWLMQR